MPSILTGRGASRLTSALALALLAMLGACRADAPTGTGAEARQVPIAISAVLTPEQQAVIAGMSVEVTGPSIAVPIVAELAVSGAAVNGTVTVPVGGQRTFTVRAFDASGAETYQGSATVNVLPGSNPPLAIMMHGRTGSVPVEVTVGTLVVAFEIDTAALLVGGATTVNAYVVDMHPTPTLVHEGTVQWASLNPVVARATPSGTGNRVAQVVANVLGTTTIVASYRGIAGAISIDVVPGPSADGFAHVVAGEAFTCAIDADSAAFCWGNNDQGQLGEGTMAAMQPRPSPVHGRRAFAQLALGSAHACGIANGAEPGGTLHCWGRASFGELGIGPMTHAIERTPQRASLGGGNRFVSATSGVTCIIGPQQMVYCNGLGIAGELGLVGAGTPVIVPTPTLIASQQPWSSLSLSQFVACGVGWAGVECATNGASLVTTASASSHTWLALEVGSESWVGPGFPPGAGTANPWACGITTARELRCWGIANHGALGAGAGVHTIATPTLVQGAQGDWEAVTTGAEFACGLRGTTAWCWGRNDAGQLGDGTLASRDVPTAVAGGHQFRRISAGLAHACGVRTDGVVMCWGANQRGELGDGTTTVRSAPVAIALSAPVTP